MPISPWTNSPIILYHGTTSRFVPSLMAGILVRLGRSRSDFGTGFYTTTSLRQAREWAEAKSGGANDLTRIIRFEVDRDALASLEGLWFVWADSRATDYWTLVRHCRSGLSNRPNHNSLWYDVVAGPVARIWYGTTAVVLDSDQISFHTQVGELLLNESNPEVVQ